MADPRAERLDAARAAHEEEDVLTDVSTHRPRTHALSQVMHGVDDAPTSPEPGPGGEPLGLVSRLCEALDQEHVRYCHFKSNEALWRSAAGLNDLDLLVDPADARAFEAVLHRLGFRGARLARWKELPGVWHSYGLDRSSGRLVHVHAHYQLLVGDDMTKNYRLPIEGPYIGSSVRAAPFLIPAPEYEFALFLVRMVIKHCPWDSIASLQGSLTASEERELAHLLERVDPDEVWPIMQPHLDRISPALWRRLLRAVQPGASTRFRVQTARRLQGALAPYGRRRTALDTWLKLWRRGRIVARRRVLRRPAARKRLAGGGRLIAIVGGDGAGKSTAVKDLTSWLGDDFQTHSVHLGKPPRSLASAAMKGAMTMAASVKRSPVPSGTELRAVVTSTEGGSMTPRTSARMVWELLTARDRYRAYRRARREATRGALVVCDRFPLREIKLMDGPLSARMTDPERWGRLVRAIAARERRVYERIGSPDVLIVMRVHPDIAVSRRSDEREAFLRPRSEEVWRTDWSRTPAVVIDAGQPKAEMLTDVRAAVWSRL